MEQKNVRNAKAPVYNNYETQEEVGWGKVTRTTLQGVWSVARAAVIFLCSVMIVGAIGLYAYQYVDSHYIAPPGGDSPAQEIIVSKGMSLNKIAVLLEGKKLVRSAQVFKYLVDFSGYGSKIKAGYYVLDGKMTMQQIMEKLAQGQEAQQVTTFTIPEGSTIEQIAALLQSQKIIPNTKKFLDLCKTGKDFTSYSFVKAAIATKNSSKRYYALEGYLFPAKYEIYVGATEEDIINKMLTKTNSVMNDANQLQAKHQGLTYDQVMTLASMIEREGKPDSFTKISAVFYNRLKVNMLLQSDVTVAYALKKSGFNLTKADTKVDSLYSTYKYKGLPLGPIANPGEKAITAALNPDEQTMKDGYLFFYVTEPETGKVEFYKTNADFEDGIAKAKPAWDAYKKKHPG
jgi:UPF0755 protein